MNKWPIIFILIFALSFNSVAANFKVGNTPDESPNILAQATQQNPTSPTSTGGGNFESTDGYPIINRAINPNYKDFNLKGRTCDIKVEIQGSGRDFEDVMIREIIDKDFENVSDIHIYIEDPLRSIKRTVYERNVTDSTMNKYDGTNKLVKTMAAIYIFSDNDIYIKIPKLKSGENVIYDYKVRSSKSGIFNVVTLFRLNGSRWSDLEKKDAIEMRPPEIEISTETDQSSAISDDFLNVTYNILHKTGWSNDELSVNLFFNNSDQYTIYYDNKTPYDANQLITLKLKPLEVTKYRIKVKYHYAGKHPIPSLDVVGATVYQKNAEIDVLLFGFFKILQDWNILISVILSVLAILLSISISYKDQVHSKKLEDELNNRISNLEKNNQQQIIKIEHTNWQLDQLNDQQYREINYIDLDDDNDF